MPLEDNKALVRYLFDAIWNQGNTTLVDQCVSLDWIAYVNLPGQEMPVPEGILRFIMTYRTAFPDMHFTIEDQVAEGDKVVTRWTARAIYSGPLMSIPPTGRQVTVSGIGIHRIVGGKIVEQWGVDDTLGMLQQLGVIPPPEQISG